MVGKKGRFSIGKKMYMFVISTVLIAALGTAAISYLINVHQIDNYFKQLTSNCAKNFASLADKDYYKALREVAETEEFQAIREKAEENDDEEAIQAYLEEKGLWEGYERTRDFLVKYLRSMDNVKYLYVVVYEGLEADSDMYLMDDDENPIYVTGYYETREAEFMGADPEHISRPVISHGDWGWLCSAYAPLYDDDGNAICLIGCDVEMDEIMHERTQLLIYIILGAVIFTVLILAGAVYFANKVIVDPLNVITSEMQKFKPAENVTYDEAGVMELDIKSRDEIEDIYLGIRSMQINIIDYLNDLLTIQKDNEKKDSELDHVKKENMNYISSLQKAENDIKEKEEMIGQISKEAYRDALTKVGNKAAYNAETEKLNADIAEGRAEFAIVMVDVNNLKKINDECGHKAGDVYIKGCCHIICETFKHSPVFRIGGDEFVVVLKGLDYKNRYTHFEELQKAFEHTFNQTDQEPWFRYSASSGMAEYSSDDNMVELVFKRADKAMYENKMCFKKKYGSYR